MSSRLSCQVGYPISLLVLILRERFNKFYSSEVSRYVTIRHQDQTSQERT